MDLSATRDCHCLATRRRARQITRRFEETLRPHGRRATQFSILAALAQTRPTLLGELADLPGLDRTELTRNANRFEDEGWVTEAGSGDTRVRCLPVTPTDRETVESASLAWKDAQEEVDRQPGELVPE